MQVPSYMLFYSRYITIIIRNGVVTQPSAARTAVLARQRTNLTCTFNRIIRIHTITLCMMCVEYQYLEFKSGYNDVHNNILIWYYYYYYIVIVTPPPTVRGIEVAPSRSAAVGGQPLPAGEAKGQRKYVVGDTCTR